jgi:hypothetical protein
MGRNERGAPPYSILPRECQVPEADSGANRVTFRDRALSRHAWPVVQPKCPGAARAVRRAALPRVAGVRSFENGSHSAALSLLHAASPRLRPGHALARALPHPQRAPSERERRGACFVRARHARGRGAQGGRDIRKRGRWPKRREHSVLVRPASAAAQRRSSRIERRRGGRGGGHRGPVGGLPTWHRDNCPTMPIGAPKTLSECRGFFIEPGSARKRQYEALRAFFVEERTGPRRRVPSRGRGRDRDRPPGRGRARERERSRGRDRRRER